MPDLRTIILHVLNIAVLYIIVRGLIYKPVLGFMNKRTQRIANDLEEARKMQSDAQAITSESQSILDNARAQSHEIINEGAVKARANADDILRMAHERAKEIVDQGRADAEHERKIINQELKVQVGDIAVKVAAEILKREVSPADNSAVIEAFFEERGA